MKNFKFYIVAFYCVLPLSGMFAQSSDVIEKTKVQVSSAQRVTQNSFTLDKIDAGVYNLSFQVWMDENSTITQLYSYQKNPWTTQTWDLSAIEKGKWVKLQKEITIEANTVDSEILFFVPNQAEAASETGSFYVDDISLEKVAALTHNVDTVDNFNIYPNPVKDFLSVELTEDSKIEIYSITGQLFETMQLNAGKFSLPMSTYKSGFYFVKVSTQTNTISRKILKN